MVANITEIYETGKKFNKLINTFINNKYNPLPLNAIRIAIIFLWQT